MKLIVSTELLYKQLAQIKFEEGERIESVAINKNQFTILTDQKQLSMEVLSNNSKETVTQNGRAWQWMRSHLKRISDTSAFLDITNEKAHLTLSY